MMIGEDVEFEEAELIFQRDTYYLCIREAKGATLSIEVERKTDGCRWRGDFTSRYIEEITQRVGNLKNFKTFVEMLRCAILRKSSALHLDLLTYLDLEKLTVRRGADNSHSTRALASDKRYLILTYVTEFDRVHYPLPLIYEENAEPAALRRCIQRLRSELDYVKAQVRKSEEKPKPAPAANSGSSDHESNTSCEQTTSVREEIPTEKRRSSLEELTANKRTIMKLMKKNSVMVDEIKRVKEAEQRMSIRVQDQAFEIALLKRRLSMRGTREGSPGPYHSFRDVSPIRSRPRLPQPSSNRSRLPPSPRCESRSSSATRKLASPSSSPAGYRHYSSPQPGSRSSSCPVFRPFSSKYESIGYAPRQKPQPISTRIPSLVSNGPKDLRKDRSPMSFSRNPRPFSSSSQDSSDLQASSLSTKRAENNRAQRSDRKISPLAKMLEIRSEDDRAAERWDRSDRKISPRPKMMDARSVKVEEIDSRLHALCHYLKSSHGK